MVRQATVRWGPVWRQVGVKRGGPTTDVDAEDVRAFVPHNDAVDHGLKPWAMNKWNQIGKDEYQRLNAAIKPATLIYPTAGKFPGGLARTPFRRRQPLTA